MAKRKPLLPDYGTVQIKGKTYFRTRLSDDDGNRISLYADSREELYKKVVEVEKQIENKTFRRSTPTVREYCEKWLLMKSANVRETTMIDYRSKVKNHIIKPLGDMKMGDVTADDIRLAIIPASKLSSSVFKSVNVLYKCIFHSALESKVQRHLGPRRTALHERLDIWRGNMDDHAAHHRLLRRTGLLLH